jgi:hypothetical protein
MGESAKYQTAIKDLNLSQYESKYTVKARLSGVAGVFVFLFDVGQSRLYSGLLYEYNL